ncbi:serine protease inhibitor [Klebsiella pneumoniae]|uniref:serine protease inhibitor n=1 Tax=Klebsiella pneumoniae TaxID=573 RepID=UPI0037C09604
MKCSSLALALFFFLFALASKPSLASRHEPSLLHTDGKNYHISAFRGVVEDGLNILISTSDECPNRSSWPELVGESGKVAVASIEKENTCLHVYLCPNAGGPCFTRDLRWDRVRVWVNEEGKVDRVPRIG